MCPERVKRVEGSFVAIQAVAGLVAGRRNRAPGATPKRRLPAGVASRMPPAKRRLLGGVVAHRQDPRCVSRVFPGRRRCRCFSRVSCVSCG